MCVEVLCWIDPAWSSKECVCCACDPIVHLGMSKRRLKGLECQFNVLKALAGTNWEQQKDTLLLTYNALGRSIAI